MAPLLRNGEEVGTLRSSGSPPLGASGLPPLLLLCIMAATEEGGIEAGRGNCCWVCSRELSSLGRSDLLGAVGLARAASSLGDTLTPALAKSLELRIL